MVFWTSYSTNKKKINKKNIIDFNFYDDDGHEICPEVRIKFCSDRNINIYY